MSDNSAIEWTDATWNPTVGCSVLTPGCTNCYAMKLAGRLEAMGQPIYRGHTTKTKAGFVWNGKVSLSNWGQVIKPLSWKKPRRIFVNSMSDLFHEVLSDAEIDQVFAVMALAPQHTFQVLTKRAERMRDYLAAPGVARHIYEVVCDLAIDLSLDVVLIAPAMDESIAPPGNKVRLDLWPLPNVWAGVSVEDQARADERIPHLLETPAAVRFLSCEPLLGPVDLDLRPHMCNRCQNSGSIETYDPIKYPGGAQCPDCEGTGWTHRYLDWIICGGESGPRARPMHPDWARSLRDQCTAAGVPFFFKQWGEWAPASSLTLAERLSREEATVLPDGRVREWQGDYPASRLIADGIVSMRRAGKARAGRLLDGREWNEFPKVVALTNE